jgi:hypothetical protein
MLLLATGGLGLALYDDPSRVGRWAKVGGAALAPYVDRALAKAVDALEAEVLPPSAEPAAGPGAVAIAVERKGEEAGPKEISAPPPVHEVVAMPTEGAADGGEGGKAQDRYLLQAVAAGLHPELSRVLLAKLSVTDFRNATYAVRTAFAKTPDDGTFRWPVKRKAGLAVFEVSFVTGAGEGCRRYVVTIEKDRWLTTALPLEKCDSSEVRISGK